MKLLYRIIIRISAALLIVLAAWAVFFYIAMIDEVNDETDDMLEEYAEQIMIRALSGDELPAASNGSNNQYYLTAVTESYARKHNRISYADSMVYIHKKQETEPARILTTIFKDDYGHYYELTVSTPTIEKKDLKESILNWIIFLYLSLLLVVVAICARVFHLSLRPLYVLLKWLDNYKPGKPNQPLDNETTISEFRKLNEAAIRNAGRAEQLLEQQKQFIGNASHEMQTPLAICLNRLEMFIEENPLTEKQLEQIVKTQQTLEQLSRLNKSLLLLSRIDNGQFPEHEKININRLVRRYLEDYQEVYGHRDITVTLQEEAPLNIDMNETLAGILVANLLKNAYTHNRESGFIRIRITAHAITFCNSGTPESLESQPIFERFYKNGNKASSTGLGLAIADAICRMQHLGLHYSFTQDTHCFEVAD